MAPVAVSSAPENERIIGVRRGGRCPAEMAPKIIARIVEPCANKGFTTDQTKEYFVEVAKNPKDEFHNLPGFDWDDASAAHSWRKAIAGQLIASIIVTEVRRGREVILPAAPSIQRENGDNAYIPIDMIEQNISHQHCLIADALSRLRNFYNSYIHLKEAFGTSSVADAFGYIEEAIKNLEDFEDSENSEETE